MDLKELCEMCPGLIGWCVLNVGFAHAQYLAIGSVTNSIVLVSIMQVRKQAGLLILWCLV